MNSRNLLFWALGIMITMHGMQKSGDETAEDSYQDVVKLISWAQGQKYDLRKFLDQRDAEDNETLLHLATALLHLEEMKLLIDHGADPNALGGKNNNERPLDYAIGCFMEKDPVVVKSAIELLCTRGARSTIDMRINCLRIRMYRPEFSPIITECIQILKKYEQK